MPLVDVGALPGLVDGIPFWSARRWAPAMFRREDFLGDPDTPLVEAVRNRIVAEHGQCPDGPVYLLANWRYFGIQANPIACYFCFDTDGETLRYIVAEVTNTPWDERHSYVLPVTGPDGRVQVEFDKSLHVSPFNPMDMVYRWSSSSPGQQLAIRLSKPPGRASHLRRDTATGSSAVYRRQPDPGHPRCSPDDPESSGRHLLAGPETLAQTCPGLPSSERWIGT